MAVTPILDRVRRSSVIFTTGTPAGVSRVGGIVMLAFSSRHGLFWNVRSPTALSDTAALRGRTRPPPKDGSESAPLRPIPILVQCSLSVKRHRRKLKPSI